MRYLVIYGTRPEAIKLSPLIGRMRAKGRVETVEVCTGQHRELLSEVLESLDLSPQYNLALMRKGQTPAELLGALVDALVPIFEKTRPDAVLVHGDTLTAFGSAAVAFLCSIPVLHIEAGLRSHRMDAPFPEEFCRRAIALTASHHFAPTIKARENLLREGIPPARITVTGNTGIDSLFDALSPDFHHPILDRASGKKLILLTAHRREHWGKPLKEAFRAIRESIAPRDGILLVYPMHKNPMIRKAAEELLSGYPNILLTDAMPPILFRNLMAHSDAIITDSGGIQEEAVALGIPALVIREVSERTEGIFTGHLTLAPCRYREVKRALGILLESLSLPKPPPSSVYGNGNASEQIAELLADETFQKNLKQI